MQVAKRRKRKRKKPAAPDAEALTLQPVQGGTEGGGGSMAIKISIVLALGILGKVASMAARGGAVGSEDMRLMGIILAQVVLLIVAIMNVEFVFCALLAYLPFSQKHPGDYGTAVNIANILIVIVIFGLLLRSVKEGGHFLVKTDLDRWIGIWFLLVFIGFFRAAIQAEKDWFLLATLVKRFCTALIMYYVASWIIRDRDSISNAIFVIMLTTLMVSILATKDTHTPTHFSWERRQGGVVNQANVLAAFVVYYMWYFFSFFSLNSSNPKYWLLLLCLYPCGRAIMIAFSRGGYVAFGVTVLFVTFIRQKLLFVFVAAGLLMVWNNPSAFLPGAVVERIESTTVQVHSIYQEEGSEHLEVSAASRLEIWKAGCKMIASNPIIGVGYGQFPQRLHEYGYGAYMDAHNGFILIAAELGLPALFVFMMITVTLLKHSLWVYRTFMNTDKMFAAIGLGYATGVVGLWIANIFGSRFNTTETMSYFWILAAIIMLIRRLHATAIPANPAFAPQTFPPSE